MGEVQYIVTLPQTNQPSAIQLPSKIISVVLLDENDEKRIDLFSDGQVIQLSPAIQSPLMAIGASDALDTPRVMN